MVDGKNRPTAVAVQHTAEIQKLKLEMEQERAQLANIQLKFQGICSALGMYKLYHDFGCVN